MNKFCVHIFNVDRVALKKSESLCSATKEKFLNSDGVKSVDENMMKSNVAIPSLYGSENECMCFMGNCLNKNIPIKI